MIRKPTRIYRFEPGGQVGSQFVRRGGGTIRLLSGYCITSPRSSGRGWGQNHLAGFGAQPPAEVSIPYH